MNVPRGKREEMSNLHVIVRPRSMKRTPVNRSKFYINIIVEIGIQKGLAGVTNSESDPLIELGESIADYFMNGRPLATFPGCYAVASEFGSGDWSPWMGVHSEGEASLYTGMVVAEFQMLESVT